LADDASLLLRLLLIVVPIAIVNAGILSIAIVISTRMRVEQSRRGQGGLGEGVVI